MTRRAPPLSSLASVHAAMTDAELLGPHFPGESWSAWRTLSKAVDGGVMASTEAALFAERTGRSTPPSEPCRELWLACGRRSGKSRFASLLAVHAACFRDYRLAPGERGVVMLVAADRKQARVLKQYVLALLETPVLAGLVEHVTRESVRLTNGVDIEIHTCSWRTTRGYTAVAAICDEVAFWSSDEMGANPDAEVIAALRPALATTGGLLVALSSPYARRGSLWRAHEKHYGKDGDPVLFWTAPTRVMNPSIPEHVVEDALAEDAAVASAEWLAEFRRDIETYVSAEVVSAAVVPGRFELPPVSGVSYVAFVDPAGGSGNDSFTLAVGHLEGERVVIDALRERRPPFSPESVVEEFCEMLRAYRIKSVMGDRYAGQWPAEQFGKRRVEYQASPRPKSDLYRDALPLLNSGRTELLDVPRLAAQIQALERRVARGGRDSIDHPPGGHDDLANVVLGLAAREATREEPLSAWVLGDTDRPDPDEALKARLRGTTVGFRVWDPWNGHGWKERERLSQDEAHLLFERGKLKPEDVEALKARGVL